MSLFYKIDKSLCLYEFFKENSVLLHIFHIIIEIEYVVGTASFKVHVIIIIFCGGIFLFVIKIFEGID